MSQTYFRSCLSIVLTLCVLFMVISFWRANKMSLRHLYLPTMKFSKKSYKKQKRRFPDLIGIGIRKCGTGVYMRFLKKHGSFRFPTWNNFETEYFSRRHSKGLRWYQNLFRPTPKDRLAIEKTPHYFYAAPKSIPEDMLKLNPRVKIFLLLCDPTPRAYSCFVQHHRSEWEHDGVLAFEKYVNKSLPILKKHLSRLDEKRKEEFLFKIWNSEYECLLAGLYSVHIERWKKHFNGSQMLVLDGEEVMRNPGPQYLKIQDFFDVPRRFRPEDWVQHNSTGHFCLHPPQNRSSLYCQDNGHGKARTRSYIAEKPNKKNIDALKSFYKPYNEKLYKILGKNYHWL